MTELPFSACAICHEGITASEVLIGHGETSPHEFHAECLLQWIRLHPSCPICRAELSLFSAMKNSAPVASALHLRISNGKRQTLFCSKPPIDTDCKVKIELIQDSNTFTKHNLRVHILESSEQIALDDLYESIMRFMQMPFDHLSERLVNLLLAAFFPLIFLFAIKFNASST